MTRIGHEVRLIAPAYVKPYVKRGKSDAADAETLKAGGVPALPKAAHGGIVGLCDQLLGLQVQIQVLEKQIFRTARKDERVKLLETIPGIGPFNASAIVTTIGSGEQFSTGRDFAAWVGLTPINKSSGGKERLGRISKMGNQYLRRLLINGMTARVRAAKYYPGRVDPWTASLLARKPTKLATVALANKAARIV